MVGSLFHSYSMAENQKYLNRESNTELLRIIAMLGIMILHADFFALGFPQRDDCIDFPFTSFLKFLIESVFIISVNVFVLISGYYGIRPKINSFLSFCFQILFFNTFFFLLFSLIIPEDAFCWSGISSIFMLDSRFWFVKAYIFLYLLAPVLNSFSSCSNKSYFQLLLISFFFISNNLRMVFQKCYLVQ